VTGSRPTPGQVARHLRQQRELGGDPLFLGDLSIEEALRLAAEGRGRERPVTRSPSGRESGGAPRGAVLPQYEALRAEALVCPRCDLARSRTHVVFSDGNPAARLMVVGEAPGAEEDRTGRAFVGRAGKLLDLLLGAVGLSRETTAYICNVLKCRPPGNRNPLPVEIEACSPFLRAQIELVAPEAILALGAFSGQFLTARESPLGQLRGQVYSYRGVPVVVTYHPAALLRNPGWTRATWDDLQLLRQVMDGA
jgi:uracil-DNA glycosylase